MTSPFTDVAARTLQTPDGYWKAIISWRWDQGSGSAVSPPYEERSRANGWLSRAHVMLDSGHCPYGLDAQPRPAVPTPITEEAWEALRTKHPKPPPSAPPSATKEEIWDAMLARSTPAQRAKATAWARQNNAKQARVKAMEEVTEWLHCRGVYSHSSDFGWGGPHGESEGGSPDGGGTGRPSVPSVDLLTRRQRMGWWLSAGPGGGGGIRIGYTRRRVAHEWCG